MRQWFGKLVDILWETYTVASREGIQRYAGALAFFAIFCLAPFLTIILGVAGIWLGGAVLDEKFQVVVSQNLGAEAGQFLQNLLRDATAQGAYAIAFAVATLFFLAIPVVIVVQTGLNAMAGIPNPLPENIFDTIRHNAFRALVVLIFQVATIFVLLLSAVFNHINRATREQLPIVLPAWTEHIIHYGFAYTVLTLAILATYALLPAKPKQIQTVLPGAFLAAVSFFALNTLFGIYISLSTHLRVFGAATALIFVLLWFYFAALIFLYGAAFNRSLETRAERAPWIKDNQIKEAAGVSGEA